MEITAEKHGEKLVLHFEGQLDTGTAPQAEVEVNQHLENSQHLVFNLEKTTFVSSAGLRVFLATAKKIKAAGGSFVVCNANAVVQEILDISGFSQILTIKPNLEEALA